MLRYHRAERQEWIRRVRFSLGAFPEMRTRDERRLLRSIALRDTLYRLVFRSYAYFTPLALVLARLVPIVGRRQMLQEVAPERPLILCMLHLGNIHFGLCAAMRLLRGRNVYVLHAGGDTGHAQATFFKRIGMRPIVTDRDALRTARDRMLQDPNAAMIVNFDHLSGRGRHLVPFLGKQLLVPTGVAYLARTTRAAIVTCYMEPARIGTRLRVHGRDEIDETLESRTGENELIERLFAFAEERVRAAPHLWTEWSNCFGDDPANSPASRADLAATVPETSGALAEGSPELRPGKRFPMSDSHVRSRTAVTGSERLLPHRCKAAGDVDGNAIARVSIVLRPKKALPDVSAGVAKPMSRAEFAREHGASHEDIAAVETFAKDAGLEIVASDAARRTIEVQGTVGALAAAFEAKLSLYEDEHGKPFRARTGALTVPASIAPIVTGVFGLDDRAQARAQFVRASDVDAAKAAAGFTPLEVANAYGFPAGDGAGQTIALIELGGGYTQSDLDTYFAGLKIGSPPVVTSVSVDGGSNAPTGSADGPDAEVALDIEVAGAIAPGAKIVAYFAANTDKGFLDAVTTAIHDTANAPNVVSISWGGPESTWTAQATQSFDDAFAAAAMLGVTITCAAGDSGSSDGVTGKTAHVDFPASSPHALACGGTHLKVKAEKFSSETVWNDGTNGGATGGGVSDVFDLPAYQQNANVPASANKNARIGRGVPDVAGNADPQSGYTTLVDGSTGVIGGTSAVAPLWAGLIARLNANLGKPLGFVNPQLYAASPSALRDITSGNNGAYKAGKGWDACTGLGTPEGVKLAALFAASGTAPAPTKSKA